MLCAATQLNALCGNTAIDNKRQKRYNNVGKKGVSL